MRNLFSRILVGVDDSDPSQHAIAFAARLAREHDGQLLVCHSVDWLPIVSNAVSSGAVVDTTPIIDSLKEDGAKLLAQAEATAKRFGVVAERHALEGNAAAGLLQLIVDAGCSLIVMGTHGRRGLGRLYIGSTTEEVLRGSTIPVLTLRSETTTNEARRCIKRVLVGLDDSEASDAALDVVLNLPAEDRQQVLFYSVVDIDTQVGIVRSPTVEAYEYAQAKNIVDGALASARALGLDARGYAVEGRPDDVIVDAAKEAAADLIVVGSHGRRGIRRFFLGSVAERIVRTATVPVLVVRPPAIERT